MAIDIGATTIKGGLVDADGRIAARTSAATRAQDGADAVLDRVVGLIDELSATASPDRIGVASCGLVDARGVVVETTDTMPGWAGTDICAQLTGRTGLPCVADNDGNVAALGEALCGAGRGARSVAGLVFGTGVGGGLVLDGRIVHGAGSMAGTFGHIKVRPGGRRCACGASGCLEAYASAWAMRRDVGCDAREVFDRAAGGDAAAAQYLDDMADAIGIGLANIAHAVNPEVIVIGGGIAAGWPSIEPRCLARFRDACLRAVYASTRVVQAALGPDAGLVGAAMLARGRM